MIERFWAFFAYDIGIDLGTTSTLVCIKGHGIVLHEPSVVAINKHNKKVLAVGEDARRMIGRTPANIVAVHPLRDGVISDFEATQEMIKYFINKAYDQYPKIFQLRRPRVVIGIPSGITEVEAKAVLDAGYAAGARKVYMIEEPMAAAIGARLPIDDATGSMIVDIGGGTTDIAVISLGGIVIDNTLKLAGNEIDEEILSYIRSKYNILIGLNMAEEIKIAIGSAIPMEPERDIDVKGRNLATNLPIKIKINSREIREAILIILDKIADAVKIAIEKTPPELLSDIIDRGIHLAGGGAQIYGIDKFLEDKVNVPVIVAEEPIKAVVLGTQTLLDELQLLEKVQLKNEDLL